MNNYAELRAALEAGPTPGPWKASQTGMRIEDAEGRLMYEAEWRPAGARKSNAAYIAACHPEAIRALLAERDALATENQRLREALRWSAGSLLAACGSGQATELDRFTLDGVTRTGTEILDMADAALAHGGSMTTKTDEPIVSLSYERADDGTYTARMIVIGLTSEEMAKAAVEHMRRLFCGESVETAQ